MPDIRFTPEAQTAVEFAHQAAAEMGHSYIGTEHLLLGLLRQEDGRRAAWPPAPCRSRAFVTIWSPTFCSASWAVGCPEPTPRA